MGYLLLNVNESHGEKEIEYMREYIILLIYLIVGQLLGGKINFYLDSVFREEFAFFMEPRMLFQLGIIIYFVGFGFLLFKMFKPDLKQNLKECYVFFFIFLIIGSLDFLLFWFFFFLKDWFTIGWTDFNGMRGGFQAAALIISGIIAGKLQGAGTEKRTPE
ncbi:MAG: hypothetical protein ACOX2P_05460 [Bacillota bacterium]|jgi:hypothetical protein